jgi:putative membrane protein
MMNDKLIFRIVTAVSIVVFLIVSILQSNIITIFPKGSAIPSWVYLLPRLNAVINGTCSILLVISLMQIRKGKISVHKALNITTFVLSSLFLVSYIIFHATGIKTTYGGTGAVRYFYYFILITHIILAAVVLPLVLLSFYSGLRGDVARHRKLVRWSFPIWLYVTVTGVIVYIMISPYYTF